MKRMSLMVTVLFAAISLLSFASYGGELEVPRYLSYQSVLMDDGGNPLSDGRHEIFFRLVGPSGEILYEERQDVEVAGGVGSVIIGSGASVDDSMSNGGVPAEALKPDGARYLEVQVLGNQPMERLELVSVPYAVYADIAAGVSSGAVDSEGIGKGAVQMKHLSKELINELAVALASNASSPLVSRSEMVGIGGASSIGINSTFVYSGARDVEQVLRDMDSAIANRQAESVKKSGDSMSGPLDMGGNAITNVATSGGANDVLTVGVGDERYVNASGDTITGDLFITNQNGDARLAVNGTDIGHKLNTQSAYAWAHFRTKNVEPDNIGVDRLKDIGISDIKTVENDITGVWHVEVVFQQQLTDANYVIQASAEKGDKMWVLKPMDSRTSSGFSLFMDGGIQIDTNINLIVFAY